MLIVVKLQVEFLQSNKGGHLLVLERRLRARLWSGRFRNMRGFEWRGFVLGYVRSGLDRRGFEPCAALIGVA